MSWCSVHEESAKSTRPGSFTDGLHKLLDCKSVSGSDEEPTLSEYDSGEGAEKERFGPSSWEVVLFYDEILSILELTEWFSMAVVGHTTESTIGDWLEVSIAAEWSVVLMDFFVTMLCAPSLVVVSWLGHCILDCIRINHLFKYLDS